MYGERRKYNDSKRRDEIAKTIVEHPEQSYSAIADDFCISENTVRRIAAEYGIGRNPRAY